MVALFVLALLVAAAAGRDLRMDGRWQSYMSTHGKVYSMGEEVLRRAIWEDNVQYIETHNRAADQGEHSYWLGENQFADMTTEEFKNTMNGYVMNPHHQVKDLHVPTISIANDTVDWRTKGYVTPIKDQQECGSCWAFSSTGSLEGQHFKSAGKLVSLSEQNLVDCSKKEGNKGCQGGLMDNAFTYIKKNKGIDTEESYSYSGINGRCRFKQASIGATDTGFKDISRSEDALQMAVSEVGPISVAMDASHKSFQLYKKGVYSERMCSSTILDHGVLAVGYGASDDGEAYWLVKNSWGMLWGQEGYFMMARNKENMCGIATTASYPLV
ncbi:procathepsin L-like [Littorina saxatilis]|uniref:Cathepsin L1-like n=1 Tax=Littorina saxatilis TaxID=31220 RepID=A0AAN9ASM5_9CAEN